MNIYGTTKPQYIEFLHKKGVLNWSDYNNWWTIETSKKEFAFIESGYPFEKNITFEQALDTKARLLGFSNEFTGYGVKDPEIFEQIKDMADWKRYLSLSQIRHAVWGPPQ